jgi:hypothetical protein
MREKKTNFTQIQDGIDTPSRITRRHSQRRY